MPATKNKPFVEIVVPAGTKMHGNSKPVSLYFYTPRSGYVRGRSGKELYNSYLVQVKPTMLRMIMDVFVDRKDRPERTLKLTDDIEMRSELIYGGLTRVHFVWIGEGESSFISFNTKFNVSGIESVIATISSAIQHIESINDDELTVSSFESVLTQNTDDEDEGEMNNQKQTVKEMFEYGTEFASGTQVWFETDPENAALVRGYLVATDTASAVFTGYDLIVFRRALKSAAFSSNIPELSGAQWAVRSLGPDMHVVEIDNYAAAATTEDVERLSAAVKKLINARYLHIIDAEGNPIDPQPSSETQVIPLRSGQHLSFTIDGDVIHMAAGIIEMKPTTPQLVDLHALLTEDWQTALIARIVWIAPASQVAITEHGDNGDIILTVVGHNSENLNSVQQTEIGIRMTADEVSNVVNCLSELIAYQVGTMTTEAVDLVAPDEEPDDELTESDSGYDSLNPPGSRVYNTGTSVFGLEYDGAGSFYFTMAGATHGSVDVDSDEPDGDTDTKVMTYFSIACDNIHRWLMTALSTPGDTGAHTYVWDDESAIRVSWLDKDAGTIRITAQNPDVAAVSDILYPDERQGLINYIDARISSAPKPIRSDDKQVWYSNTGLASTFIHGATHSAAEVLRAQADIDGDIVHPYYFPRTQLGVLIGALGELNIDSDTFTNLRLFNPSRLLNLVYIAILEKVETNVAWGEPIEVEKLVPNVFSMLSVPEQTSIISRVYTEASRTDSLIEVASLNKLRKIKSLVVIKGDTPDQEPTDNKKSEFGSIKDLFPDLSKKDRKELKNLLMSMNMYPKFKKDKKGKKSKSDRMRY